MGITGAPRHLTSLLRELHSYGHTDVLQLCRGTRSLSNCTPCLCTYTRNLTGFYVTVFSHQSKSPTPASIIDLPQIFTEKDHSCPAVVEVILGWSLSLQGMLLSDVY